MSTSTPPAVLHLSTRVRIAAGTGTIRFVGQTSFAPGKWVGVELDEPNGKNDGSVAGKRYFRCNEGNGMFVKPGMVRLLHDEEGEEDSGERDESPTPAPIAPPSRPPSTATRPTVSGALPSTSTTRAARPSGSTSSTSLSASGRTSTLSPTLKLPTKSALTAPRLAARTVSTKAVAAPASARAVPTPSGSSSGRSSALGHASRLSVSTMPPPSVVRNPASSGVPGSNFAPPPGGTRRALPAPPRPLSGPATGIRRSSVVAATPRPSSRSTNPEMMPPPSTTTRSTTTMRALVSPPPSASRRPSSSSLIRRSSSVLSGGRGTEAERRYSGSSRGGAGSRLGFQETRMEQEQEDEDEESGSLLGEEMPGVLVEAEMELGEDALEQSNEDWLKPERRDSDEELKMTGQPSDTRVDPFSLKGKEAKTLAEATVPKKEHEELQAKLRILEARRAEDRERLREVDKLKEESEEWLRVKEKSKAKISEMAAELKILRKQNKDLSLSSDAFQLKFSDLNDQVEMSLLDKEVAEERFEAAQAALDAATERVAELEIEVAVLKEENSRMESAGDAEVAEGGNGARSSLAYVQLEKQNLRLKDALVRLRDLTSETDAENRRRIVDLEKELDLTSDLQAILDNTTVELDRAEQQIEDLKIQLDDAMGAEDMLEQLTERNLSLSEKLEEMQNVIEDLEALKELNDELEENHMETEKQLQEEIDLKDLQIRELAKRSESLAENVADYESTIGQFRDLVYSLQSDLEQLRQQQASQQSESQSLTSQSQAMLNLNLKLQTSMLKGQVKTIELELRKLDAQQALQHLAIIQPYLLPAYFEEDNDAVDSLLFFERLAYKTDIVGMVIEQRHNVTESLNTVVPESLIAICETRAKLARFASLNKRFSAQLKRCPPELFLKMGRIHHEVSTAEKRIDYFIESLRKEELREVDCARETDGLIAQMEHLAELHLEETLLDLAEREHSYINALDLDFDTIAAATGFTKQALATLTKDLGVADSVRDASLDELFFQPLQNLVNLARNSKVVTKKLLRRLDDLISNSSALSIDHVQGCETLAYNSSAIASGAAKLAAEIGRYCSEIRTSKEPFQVSAILSIAQEVTATELGKQSTRPLDEISALLTQLSQDVATTLAAASDGDHVVKLAYTAPWVARVEELQHNAAVTIDAERKVVKLNEEIRDLVREMRTKDQSYQESAVKIELMEKRMEAVKKQAEAVVTLESELAKSKKQEKSYEDAIEALQGDLDAMEQEINKLKLNAPAMDKPGSTNSMIGEGEIISYEGNMETSRLIEQIDSLRGAVRFLRSENSYLKSQDLLAELEELPTYRFTPPSTPEPTLTRGLPVYRHSPSPTRDPLVARRTFETESKLLWREARVLSATPRLVDLSVVRPGGKLGGWQSMLRAPESQYRAEKERVLSLGRRVEKLWAMRPPTLI